MIEVTLRDWEESDLQNKVVQKCVERIISSEFKLYGDVPDAGCYTPYDKFKNFVANLVADRIYQHMMDNDAIKMRINKAIDNAEKTIVKQYMKHLYCDSDE